MQQRTLAAHFRVEGIGIHTGASCRVTVYPSDEDTGRVFQSKGVAFPAHADFVVDTTRCTTLGYDSTRISTVEHLLSALAGCYVDNALIVVEGPEIPILDGSALPFVEAIRAVGITDQARLPRIFGVKKPLAMNVGESSFQAKPAASGLMVELLTEFSDWPEGYILLKTRLEEDSAAEVYASTVAPARTFAFQWEVDALLAAGLAKGGSLDNALVITPPDGFSSPLRLPSEWCAHKMLDMIGDLALVNARLQMHIAAERPGHTLNTRFAAALLANGNFL